MDATAGARGATGRRSVTCTLGVSLDGYVVGPDGRFDWAAPDPELFRSATDQVRDIDVYVLGRRLYESMLFWENAAGTPSLDEPQREFAALWQALPKVVFSGTLTAVRGNARLVAGGLADEIGRLRDEPGNGEIAVGGATLAAAAADLVDEYRTRVYPVLVGGGVPLFPRGERRVDLELVGTQVFPSGVVELRHHVVGRPLTDR